jgi:hypothetical protein
MQISCPCCHTRFGLEAALADDAAREMMGLLAQLPAELSRPLAAYLGLFRPAARALAWDRREPPSMIMRRLDAVVTHTSDAPMATAALLSDCTMRWARWRCPVARQLSSPGRPSS